MGRDLIKPRETLVLGEAGSVEHPDGARQMRVWPGRAFLCDHLCSPKSSRSAASHPRRTTSRREPFMKTQRASGRARIGKAIPRLTGGRKVLCEPCFERGRRRTAQREIAGTLMCRWCALGLPPVRGRAA